MHPPGYGRRLRGARLRLALLPLAYAADVAGGSAHAEESEFDANMLRLRGIDPKLAEYFREAPRFTEGRHVVSLQVNGRSMGRVNARFNDHGLLCVDRALLDVAEVDSPEPGSDCVDMMSVFPTANVDLDPARAEVSLLLPSDALRSPVQDISGYARGGTAALVNYEIVGLDSHWGSRHRRYGSANTELGFNAGDWVVRSRQASTSSDGRDRTEVLDTYAQRSFAANRTVIQVGEINMVNSALSGAQITGVQVMSEQALAAQGNGATVEGVARSQSRVEVRQEGAMVYSTVVPVGSFTLTNIPRISRHSDLDVTVLGAGGESQRFTVTAAMAGSVASAAGYSLAVGRTRNAADIDTPWVIGGGWSRTIRRNVTLSSGALLASNYQAVGLGAGTQLPRGTQLHIDASGSRASHRRLSGAQAVLTALQRLNERWSFALSHTRQSEGFRQLLDTAASGEGHVRRTRYRDQSSASLAWSRADVGSLSAGYSRLIRFDGRTTKRALASWGHTRGPCVGIAFRRVEPESHAP